MLPPVIGTHHVAAARAPALGRNAQDGDWAPRRFRLAAACFAFLLGAGSVEVAVGAEPPEPAAVEPDFTAMSLEDLATIEVPTVYGASRREQKLTEAPSAVSIVTAEDIKKFGYRTLADVLRSVRGFYVSYDRGYNAIGVRGVNRPGDYGGRMLITVDGHRLNDPIYDTAASGTDFILDVDVIERVEVIRGPGSSLYGNNAFFGVINVITRKGGDVKGTELSGSGASLDTYAGRITYGNKFANGVEAMISGTYYDSAGNRRLYYPEFAAINNGVAENLDGASAPSAFASISWKGLSVEAGYVHRKKAWPTAPYSTDDAIVIFNDPHLYTIDERTYADLQFQHAFENKWDVLARASYDYYGFEAEYPYDYLDPLRPLTLNKDEVQAQSVGAEVQVSKTFLQKHHVTAGAELRSDFELEQRNFDVNPPATYLDSHDSAKVFSVYAQGEFQALKSLIVNAGVRYDHFSTFGNAVNPRIALIFQPGEPTTFKIIYGQAYRAPNAYENYYVSASNKANPALGPERISAYELVYEQKLGKRSSLNASLFVNNIKDLIRYQQDPADGFYYFDNVDSATARGAEFEVSGQSAGGVRGSASYTYTHTSDGATGERMSDSPEHLGQLRLSVPLWRAKLFGSLEAQAMSRRGTVRGGSVGGFVVVNATLFGRELLNGLEFSGSVYNVFDQSYSDPVAPDFTQEAVPQDGRAFRVKLTYRF